MIHIAALVVAHARPHLYHDLLSRLSPPLWTTYVHVDAKSDVRLFQSEHAILLEDRVRITWGGYNLTEAALRLLRTAYADPSVTHFFLMSGQCVPVKTDAEIAAALAARPDGGTFIDIEPMPSPTKPFERLTRLHFRDVRNRWVRGALKQGARVLPPRSVDRALRGITPYAGASWWLLGRPAVARILAFLDENPWFLRAFRYAHSADEMVFQTLVMHLGIPVDGGCPTFTRWIQGEPHPEPLAADELEALTALPFLMARKRV